MAGPITWRNVGGDGGRMGAQLLNGGQNQLNNAADGLLRTLDQYRKINVANAGLIKQDNTQNFLDQVAAAGGADKLASPEVQAQLDQSRISYGNTIDRTAARSAVNDRLAALQGAALKTQNYNDVQQEVSQRPVLEDLAQKLYAGDSAGYNDVLANNNLRDEASLRKQLQSYTDDRTNAGYRAAGEQRAQGAEQRAIGADGRAQQSFNLSQELGQESLTNTREERAYRTGERDLKAAADAIKRVGDESAGELAAKQAKNIFATGSTDVNKDTQTILSKAGLGEGEFDKWFGTDSGSRQNVQQATTAMLTDGIKLTRDGKEIDVPIPPALVEQYLSSVKGKMYITKDPGKAMGDYFSEMFKDNPELQKRAFDGLDAKKEHTTLINSLKKKEREFRMSKNPSLSSTLDDIQSLRTKIPNSAAPTSAMLPGREADNVPTEWPPKDKVSNFY